MKRLRLPLAYIANDCLWKKNHRWQGDVVLVLEAMKMANRIVMPFDGTIKAIHVKKGDIVPKNQLMVEIEPLR
jgi:acetyl/propionyl-CoA carboxylase alpha subunit